jgi:hypothetical protein
LQELGTNVVIMGLVNRVLRRICTVLGFGFCMTALLPPLNAQDIPTVYPAGTTLYLKLNKDIDSSTAVTGEPVEATIIKPALGLPSGTGLVGIVEIARPANAILKSPAEIRLGFNKIHLPSGEERRATAPLRNLGPSRVIKESDETEIVQLDKANLFAQGVFRLGAIAISESDKKRVQINSGTVKTELSDAFSLSFARYEIEGIGLRPSAGELLDKIEATLDRPLRIEKHDTGATGVFAIGSISDDGFPTIVIGTGGTLTETVVVHELFHIDQRIRQFPNGIRIGIVVPFVADPGLNSLLQLFSGYLLDPIEHAIFFPRMITMGLNPYDQEAESIKRLIAAGEFPIETHDMFLYRTEALSLWYVAAVLGIDDPAFVSANDRLFQEEGLFESLWRGQATINMFKSRNPQTPQAAAETIIASLNCLLGNFGTFSFYGWASTQKGNVEERTALITLRPLLFATPRC